mgnify:CR=1 FL=1
MQGTLLDIEVGKEHLADLRLQAEKAHMVSTLQRPEYGTKLKQSACSIGLLSETRFCAQAA